jgi:hypothetical protein
MEGLEPVADVSAGDWIVEALPGLLGTVASVVPRGLEVYARVLHPVEFFDGRPSLTWAEVCRLTGRIPHALMQWGAITRPTADAALGTAPSGVWDDGDVRVGSLAPPALRTLIDVLAPVTGAQDCFHALWDGWGWVDGSGVALPRLRLPGRDYLVFRGLLQAALNMGWHGSPTGFQPQSPSLLWPTDHSWCIGTEIDFDSTLVGGSADLVGAVRTTPGLEAWPVEPDDDLTASGDRLNSSS